MVWNADQASCDLIVRPLLVRPQSACCDPSVLTNSRRSTPDIPRKLMPSGDHVILSISCPFYRSLIGRPRKKEIWFSRLFKSGLFLRGLSNLLSHVGYYLWKIGFGLERAYKDLVDRYDVSCEWYGNGWLLQVSPATTVKSTSTIVPGISAKTELRVLMESIRTRAGVRRRGQEPTAQR